MKPGDRVSVLWNGRRRVGTLLHPFRKQAAESDETSRAMGSRTWLKVWRQRQETINHWEVELDRGGQVGVPVSRVEPLDAITELGRLA